MRMTWLAPLVLWLGGCLFNPDLSRFPLCGPQGQCPSGSACLAEEQRCVPSCGEHCAPDAGAVDAGTDEGVDAGSLDSGAPLALAATVLPAAVETRPYTHTFSPSGGEGGYHFSIDGGVPGFSLDVAGTLATAAAPTAGTFPFAITVQDDGQPRAVVTTPFSLEVRPLLRVASAPPLVEGRQGQPYSEPLSATGGQAPYTWVVDGGTLPAGLSLTPAGVLQGTPGSAGSLLSFGVSVRDAATPPQQATRSLSVQVKVVDPLLAIATRGAADGRVGTAYTQPLKAFGGTQPYSWSVLSGALPPGVALVDTGTLGRIAGTPTLSGSFTFTVHCADTLTSQNQALTIVVY